MAQQNPAASGNLNSNNGSARPNSVDMAEAMALMADAGDAGDDEAEETASADEDAGDDATAEDDGEGDETAEEAADEEAEAAAEDAEAPEFWSADDKAAWESVPAELRPVLKKYEQQRVEFVNEKAREAAAGADPGGAGCRSAPTPWSTRPPSGGGRPARRCSRPSPTSGPRSTGPRSPRRDPAEWARLDQDPHDRRPLLAEANRRASRTMPGRRRRAPSRPSSRPSAPSTPSWRTSCPTTSAARRRRSKTYDDARQVPVRQGHPGRPHQPDP